MRIILLIILGLQLYANSVGIHPDNYRVRQSEVSTYARNLLIYLGELEYKAPIILPDMNKSALITEPYAVDIPKEEYGVINIYPNPAKDYIIFEYDIEIE